MKINLSNKLWNELLNENVILKVKNVILKLEQTFERILKKRLWIKHENITVWKTTVGNKAEVSCDIK